jgi:hypothetical protein
MIHNIILIVLIILILFFISDEKKINDLISKKYIKHLFILLIIYFIYQNYNFSILVIFLLIIIFLNINIQEKFIFKKYLKNYENFKKIIIEYFNDMETKESKESFLNNVDKINNINKLNDNSYDFTPFVKEDININIDLKKENNENKIEPFKTEVLKLKDLYENIKLEITKLK